jgi:hypothetical protein
MNVSRALENSARYFGRLWITAGGPQITPRAESHANVHITLSVPSVSVAGVQATRRILQLGEDD